MTNRKTLINDFDALGIRGSRITNIKQLTQQRWYIIQAGRGEEVHARFTGVNSAGEARFEVYDGDRVTQPGDSARLSSVIFRSADNIASGARFFGIPCAVFKFTTHPDKVAVPTAPEVTKPQAFPEGTEAWKIDAKVGDRFLVVKARPGVYAEGDVVELARDDGSENPFFYLVRADGTARTSHSNCMFWSRLAPLPVVAEPEPVLHEIDQLKSEIDGLVANATAKRDEAARLQLAAGKIEAEAEALRQKLADSLAGYLPKKPVPFRGF